jgi:uncharacterized protein with von Willebrand factor type A (vWA) domain
MSDLEQRLDAVCESMESAAADYIQSTQCLVEALQGIHQRIERLEKWIESEKNERMERLEKWIESEKNLAAKA